MSPFELFSKEPRFTIKYIDGSGNEYFINKNTLLYRGVKKEESSSGIYDGGEDKKVKFDYKQSKEIRSIVYKLIKDKENHIEKRIMTSGMLIKRNKRKDKIYYIHPNSELKSNLEKNLNTILKD